MAFTARPQLRCSWGWVPTLRSISSTSPVSSMMPATMPRWSISCTSIRGASAVLSMLHKIPHPPSVPAECGLRVVVLCFRIVGHVHDVGNFRAVGRPGGFVVVKLVRGYLGGHTTASGHSVDLVVVAVGTREGYLGAGG